MLKPSLFLKLILIGSTLALNLLLISLPLQAQDNGISDSGEGTEDTNPGGTRGRCLGDADSQPLTAIIPVTEQRLELTTLPHPTVLIYIPKTVAKTATFVIVDKSSDSMVYKTEINLQKQPGILAIEMPKNQPELQAGINYRWTVSLECNSSNPPFVQGWIKRIQPSSELTQALQEKTSADQWLVYANEGIWYDAIAALAVLRQAEPNNPELESYWQKLLQDVKLNGVATAPLIQP